MRFLSQVVRVPVLFVLFVVIAAPAWATSIPVRGKSTYGISGLLSGTSQTANGIVESLDCASSASDCPGNFDLLGVSIPNLTPGTVITLNGVGSWDGLICENTSFLGGDCPGGTVSPDQQSCLDSLNPTNISGGFQITAASCALASKTGNSMFLVFLDPNSTFATSVSVSHATSTPEPASLALLGVGLVALGGKLRRKRA
jgi:hypothetical protein